MTAKVINYGICCYASSWRRLLYYNAKNAIISKDSGYLSFPKTLTKVVIGEKVESIPAYFVYGCNELTSITIPESVTSIGSSAFRDCSSLTSITIPESVTSIEEFAFSGCSSLTSITIPESVTSIGDYVFYGCSSLTSITILESVTSIGDYVFYGCSSLTSITIPESVTSIGSSAFRDCSSLTSITIPESVTSIGGYAFAKCPNMTELYYNAKNAIISKDSEYLSFPKTITKVVIGEKVESIPAYFVYGCNELTSITIPESVTSIGSSAFCDCSSLTSITIPESVTSVGKSAFKDCSKIKTVTIKGCPDIDDESFAGCPRISNVYVHSMEAPYLGNGVFEEEVKQYAILHIPTGTEDVYSIAYCWREFQNVKADIEMSDEDKYTTFSIHFAGQGIVEQTVKMHEALTLLVTADDNSKINTVLYNGEDVTNRIIGGHFTTPLVNGPATLTISVEVNGDGIQYAASPNVKVYGRDGSLYISGLEENTEVMVYDLNGVLQLNENVDGDTRLNLADGVYVVKLGNRTFKVAM